MKIAVVGCGYWGKNLVRNFAQLGVLHAVCDIDSEIRQQIALSYPDVEAVSDYNDILQDKEINGVVIATPPNLHYPMAKQALLAGKDVFVEKPFTTNVKEAEELVTLSMSEQRILMVGHLMVYHPAIQMLKKYIQEGELGKIYYLYSTRVNLGQIRYDENALWRIAPHDIAIFIYLLDTIPSVISAQGYSYLQPNLVDVVFAGLRFGEVVAHFQVSWLDPHKIRQLTVVGNRKMAVFDDMELEHKLKIYDKGVRGNSLLIREGEVVVPEIEIAEPLYSECVEFIECIETRRQPLADAKQGLEVVKVLETVSKLIQGVF